MQKVGTPFEHLFGALRHVDATEMGSISMASTALVAEIFSNYIISVPGIGITVPPMPSIASHFCGLLN